MGEPLRHRQTKEAATDMFDLQPPRHIPTLPEDEVNGCPLARQLSEAKLTLCASCKGRRFAISATRRACNFRNNAGLPLALQRTLSKELDGKRECENRCI